MPLSIWGLLLPRTFSGCPRPPGSLVPPGGRRISSVLLTAVPPTPSSILSQTGANLFWSLRCLFFPLNLQVPFKAKSGREGLVFKARAKVREFRALLGGLPLSGKQRVSCTVASGRHQGAFPLGQKPPERVRSLASGVSEGELVVGASRGLPPAARCGDARRPPVAALPRCSGPAAAAAAEGEVLSPPSGAAMAEPVREELSALGAIFCGPDEWEVLSLSGDYPRARRTGRPLLPTTKAGLPAPGPRLGAGVVE